VNRSLNAGDTLSATVSFDDVVTLNAAGGSPTLALQIGSSVVQATYISGTGTNTWIFTATIVAGLNDTDGVSLPLNALTLNGAILSDAAGNACVITSAVILSNPLFLVDTTVPTVVITSDISVLKAGDTANITFTLSEETGSSFAWDGSGRRCRCDRRHVECSHRHGPHAHGRFHTRCQFGQRQCQHHRHGTKLRRRSGQFGGSSASPSFSLDTVAPHFDERVVEQCHWRQSQSQ
jgi:large repetitive protein